MDIGDVAAAAWLVATAGAFALAVWEAMRRPGSGVRRMLLLLLGVALWAGLQFGLLLLVMFLNYCEDCSGRPVTARDVVMAAILWIPTALAWSVLLAIRARAGRQAAAA
jgi:hypothetical protein